MKIKHNTKKRHYQRMKNKRDTFENKIFHPNDMFYYNSFLSLATGISNCSLYLATVRLAIG